VVNPGERVQTAVSSCELPAGMHTGSTYSRRPEPDEHDAPDRVNIRKASLASSWWVHRDAVVAADGVRELQGSAVVVDPVLQDCAISILTQLGEAHGTVFEPVPEADAIRAAAQQPLLVFSQVLVVHWVL
jgi:hypothetical protein